MLFLSRTQEWAFLQSLFSGCLACKHQSSIPTHNNTAGYYCFYPRAKWQEVLFRDPANYCYWTQFSYLHANFYEIWKYKIYLERYQYSWVTFLITNSGNFCIKNTFVLTLICHLFHQFPTLSIIFRMTPNSKRFSSVKFPFPDFWKLPRLTGISYSVNSVSFCLISAFLAQLAPFSSQNVGFWFSYFWDIRLF